jgi:glycosyltransferase involved in cell wall biosynthesis
VKKNVLIISTYYPPINSIASNRIYSFAKYIDKSKYNVTVLTLDTNEQDNDEICGVSVLRVKNNTLFKPFQFNKRTNKFIHYIKVLYNKLLYFFKPDIYGNWIKNGYEKLKKDIKNNKYDIMISSYAPVDAHLLALKLKSLNPSLKWIADFRDEMSLNPFLSDKVRKRYKKIETKILKNADAVITVSKPLLDEFRNLSENKNLKFKEIRNGYDFELEDNNYKNDIFTITYTGNFYAQRNPNNFLIALEKFIEKNNVKVNVKFVGVKTHFNIPDGLKKYINIYPQVSHEESIEFMKKSDVLLLIHPTNGRKGIYTGKLFEYLACLKPILALVDENDVAADLIRKCNAGYVSDNNNIEKIEKIIEKLYVEWKEDYVREYNIDEIKTHHRKNQVKLLENLIEELNNG